MNRIKFGTSGWRGILPDDFTFERYRLVAAAVAPLCEEARDESRVMAPKEGSANRATRESGPCAGDGGSGRGQ